MTRTMRMHGTTFISGTMAVGAVLAAGVMIAVPTATAYSVHSPSAPSRTSTAIEALTTLNASRAQQHIPADFGRTMGYTPVVQDALLVNPSGDCSSPVPLPTQFDTACKAHDLGYDLLRFGASVDTAQTAGARQALDDRLATEMHSSCKQISEIGSRTACYASADIAGASVRFNSWRQHYGPPESEPALPFLLAGALVTALLAMASATAALAGTRHSRTVAA